MIKELMGKWLVSKEKENQANEERLKVEIELYKEIAKTNQITRDGAFKIERDGLKCYITTTPNISVDQEKAKDHPELFSVKYGYSKTVLKTLNDFQVSTLNDIITLKPGKPSFKIEVL